MKKVRWVSATAGAALVAAMFALPGAGGVGGDSHNGNTTGNRNISLGSGNTITAPVSAPVNVCGNAVAAAGFANANCKGGSTSCIGSHCNHPNCQGQCHDCAARSAIPARVRSATTATARSATTATARSATTATATTATATATAAIRRAARPTAAVPRPAAPRLALAPAPPPR